MGRKEGLSDETCLGTTKSVTSQLLTKIFQSHYMFWKMHSGISLHCVSVAVVFAKRDMLSTFLQPPNANSGM